MKDPGILELVPWRPPFLFVDRLVQCTAEATIRTEKTVTSADGVAEDGASGAFPAFLLLEGMSQSAAILFRLSRPEAAAGALPVLGFLQAEFHGSAFAGDVVVFDVRVTKMTDRGGVFEARASSASRLLAQAELAFAAKPPTGDLGP